MKKTLVIGASENPERYSYIAIHRLRQAQHEVVALGLKSGKVADVEILTDLDGSIDDIDTITLYVGPRHQPSYYDLITQINPTRVIFNPGTENPELYNILQGKGISYVEACTLVLLSTQSY